MRVFTAGLTLLLLTGACKKPDPSALTPMQADEILQMLRARPVPDPAQARFSVKIASDKLGIKAPRLGGGLVVQRPDHAYLAVLDPIGSPVLTLTSDGTGVVLINNRDKQYVVEQDAAGLISTKTAGAMRIGDLVDVLLGLLPITDASVRRREQTDAGLRLTFDAPEGWTIDALIDPVTGTPTQVVVDDAKGHRAVVAAYEPYQVVEGRLMPTRLELHLPVIDLHLDLMFKTWKQLDTAPDVFSPGVPTGYEVVPFAVYAQNVKDSMGGGDTPAGSE